MYNIETSQRSASKSNFNRFTIMITQLSNPSCAMQPADTVSVDACMMRIAADLAWLVAQPKDSVVWTGTRRDLVEMVQLTWLQHTIIDDRGCPCPRKRIAEMAFAAVGLSVPKNLSHIVSAIGERISPDSSMLSRYRRLANDENVIRRFIQS